MHPSLLFARTLCGHYSNREQAQNDPSKFAHINIFFMPLPWDVLKGPGFYSEQSYDHDPWRPYRQGVHRLRAGDNGVHVVENFGMAQPERVAGAPQHPALLAAIQPDTLQARCGSRCTSKVVETMLMKAGLSPAKDAWFLGMDD